MQKIELHAAEKGQILCGGRNGSGSRRKHVRVKNFRRYDITRLHNSPKRALYT